MQQATVITWPTPTPITYGTPLSGFQLDATASTGVVSVPLAGLYNVTGIYSPGSHYSVANSFDNDGYSYQTTTLSGSVVWNGLTFAIGPNNAPDAVSNITIPLPAGNFSNLYMLGAMVNNIGASQTFVVTYTDNSTLTFTQNMSDWFNVKGWPGESVISCSEDRNFQTAPRKQIQRVSSATRFLSMSPDSEECATAGYEKYCDAGHGSHYATDPWNICLHASGGHDRAGGNGYLVGCLHPNRYGAFPVRFG